MGNNRGTKYSNVSLQYPEQDENPARWDFSWAELGMYDGQAFMDEIIRQTGQPKVNYIGYSMGTTQMFYGLTKREEDYYMDNMNKFIAIAPCVYMETTSW
jgi:pimeloyl-ACP methyl ester carboxylesterase